MSSDPRIQDDALNTPDPLCSTVSPPSATAPRNLLLFCAFIALSCNLRAPITSLPPVISALQAELGISQSTAGLLTAIPVLCFGLAAPLASALITRIGMERGIFVALAGIALGSAIRPMDGIGIAITGTLLLGLALTVGNIVGLMVISRDFPHCYTMMTSLYVCAMSSGAMLTSALTEPLARVVGWRPALASWGGLAILAVLLWLGVIARSRRKTAAATSPAAPTPEAPAVPLLKRRIVWLLAIAFAAHTSLFYGLTAWLPQYLERTADMSAMQAGIVASLFQILGLLGCFGVPWLLSSPLHPSRRQLFLCTAGCWLVTAAGLLAAPGLWPVWSVTGGIGSGGGFVVVFMLVVEHARDLDDNRRISAFVQGIGYTAAAASPAALGALHQITGTWTPGFYLLVAISLIMAACGFAATARRHAA